MTTPYYGHVCTIDCAWGCIEEDALIRHLERQFKEDEGDL
jgi:hypothetical protein